MDVIALISGGKDSFYSILHCIANGHRIIALANLHPPVPNRPSQITTYLPTETPESFTSLIDGTKDELDSFMYQTVGHGLLPFYPNALNIPLYRYPITGSSVDRNLSYRFSTLNVSDSDETEDLVPLLQHILERHPTAKAISTGAILSTYQRTRIESVCERLGLISLSYLWQRRQEEILEEMDIVGLDARVVKVAAVGLDAEKWIWRNVTDVRNRKFLEGLQRKWGVHVAGEGGEYETIVVDGPGWRGRIEVNEGEREIVDGGGGVGHAKILNARFVTREGGVKEQKEWVNDLKRPSLWDQEFERMLPALREHNEKGDSPQPRNAIALDGGEKIPTRSITTLGRVILINNLTSISIHMGDISQEMKNVMTILSKILGTYDTDFSRITSTTLLLRSMKSFAAINKAYYSHFITPNPPSRVCISVGNGLPAGVNVMLSVVVDLPAAVPKEEEGRRKGLHVQGRSYWAPANIGPYSQSISVDGWTALAGMIPLVPASMEVVNTSICRRGVEEQAVLALQHMWRVAISVDAMAILGCVAYVVDEIGMDVAQKVWKQLWKGWKGESGFRGLWGDEGDGGQGQDEEGFDGDDGIRPPLLTVSVEELPRACAIEWAGIGLESTWLEKAKRRHEDENDDNHDAFSQDRWGIQTGAELSTDGVVTSSSMWYGGWNDGRRIHLPSGGGGGIKILSFPSLSTGSRAEKTIMLVREVVMKMVSEDMGFVVAGVAVYIPAATGTIGDFMEVWDEIVKRRNIQVAVQVIPVKKVWDCNSAEVGLGVVVRMCGP